MKHILSKRIGGLLFIIGAVQFVIAVFISQAIYPSYDVLQQVTSDLGNWSLSTNSAIVFNISLCLLGAFMIAGAYFIQKGLNNRTFTSLFVIAGISIIVTGFITENIFLPVHLFFSVVTFVFIAACSLTGYKFEKSPVSYLSASLGAVAFLAMILFVLGLAFGNSNFDLGLGKGGMERLIIYPCLLALFACGACLITGFIKTLPAEINRTAIHH